MNLLEHVRELFDSSAEWSEMCDLQEPAQTTTGPDRDAACQRIADLLDSYADRMERSGLVRAFGSAFTPDGLRAEAAAWREGRDPNE